MPSLINVHYCRVLESGKNLYLYLNYFFLFCDLNIVCLCPLRTHLLYTFVLFVMFLWSHVMPETDGRKDTYLDGDFHTWSDCTAISYIEIDQRTTKIDLHDNLHGDMKAIFTSAMILIDSGTEWARWERLSWSVKHSTHPVYHTHTALHSIWA